MPSHRRRPESLDLKTLTARRLMHCARAVRPPREHASSCQLAPRRLLPAGSSRSALLTPTVSVKTRARRYGVQTAGEADVGFRSVTTGDQFRLDSLRSWVGGGRGSAGDGHPDGPVQSRNAGRFDREALWAARPPRVVNSAGVRARVTSGSLTRFSTGTSTRPDSTTCSRDFQRSQASTRCTCPPIRGPAQAAKPRIKFG